MAARKVICVANDQTVTDVNVQCSRQL